MKLKEISEKIGRGVLNMFKKRKPCNMTFADWVSRLAILLEDSYKEVKLSTKEDSFENVLRAFRIKSKKLFKSVKNTVVRVDNSGVFITNYFNEEKIYIVNFDANGAILGLPLAEEYESVGFNDYIDGVLINNYKHLLAKLENQEKRLKAELSALSVKRNEISFLLAAVDTSFAKSLEKAKEVAESKKTK